MEVLKSGDAPDLVSNLEVMQLLQERIDARQSQENDVGKEENGNRNTTFQNRDWIEETVLNHLQSSPVGGADVKVEDMPKLVEQLRRDPATAVKGELQSGEDEQPKGYGLTNAETLQILNHLPTSLVEVHLLIEDIEKRKNLDEEEKQSQFMRLVSQYSGRPVEDGGGDDDEGGEDEGGEDDEME